MREYYSMILHQKPGLVQPSKFAFGLGVHEWYTTRMPSLETRENWKQENINYQPLDCYFGNGNGEHVGLARLDRERCEPSLPFVEWIEDSGTSTHLAVVRVELNNPEGLLNAFERMCLAYVT